MFVYTEGPVTAGVVKNVIINQVKNIYINISSSSSVDATARCGLWPVEQIPLHLSLSITNSLHLLTPST